MVGTLHLYLLMYTLCLESRMRCSVNSHMLDMPEHCSHKCNSEQRSLSHHLITILQSWSGLCVLPLWYLNAHMCVKRA